VIKNTTFVILFAFGLSSGAQPYCVMSEGAKLYARADLGAPVVSEPPVNTPLIGLNDKIAGDWVQVQDRDGQKAWSPKKQLTTAWSCLSIDVPKTSLRKGPGEKFPLARPHFANKSQSFKDLGGEDGWTQVEDRKGRKFWVNIDDVWKAQNRMRISFEQK